MQCLQKNLNMAQKRWLKMFQLNVYIHILKLTTQRNKMKQNLKIKKNFLKNEKDDK